MRDVLDDAATLRAADPRGVVAAFEATGDQLRRAHDAARDAAIPFAGEARSVTFCAMGGSAAAGDLIAAGFGDRVRLPLSTLRGYRVPAGYGEEDVVVCVSYSGDTEETLGAFDAARERGCTVIAVCGGGALADRARESDTPVVEIPADAPVPRAGLGALVGGALGAVVGAGLASGVDEDLEDAATTADALSAEFGPDRPTTDNEAKVIAEWVGDRIPVIWGSEGVSGAAAWR
ncbi:MAG TPA: hypothetical protein VHH92_01040, partial [Actinomycetota bacterium]|nr:hypothetical protein [Actinomycetota bacterium]